MTALIGLLRSSELVGVARAAIERSVAYVKERQQFGRPVGSFQAVQHRLANMYLHTESAASLTRFAEWAAINDQEQFPGAADAAAGYSCEQLPGVAESAIQCHGSVGMSASSPLHLFLRRALMGASLIGGQRLAYQRLGRSLLADTGASSSLLDND